MTIVFEKFRQNPQILSLKCRSQISILGIFRSRSGSFYHVSISVSKTSHASIATIHDISHQVPRLEMRWSLNWALSMNRL